MEVLLFEGRTEERVERYTKIMDEMEADGVEKGDRCAVKRGRE